MFKSIAIFLVCLMSFVYTNAQDNHSRQESDSIVVAGQLNDFITAFRNFDVDRFKSFFADNVTVFFPPSAGVSGRIDGKEKVMEVFLAFFKHVKEKKPDPPYLEITPEKLRVSVSGDIAVVTFELDDKDSLGRRTIILQKIKGRYLIIHLHASKVDYVK